MMMENVTLDHLRSLAEHAGLNITEEELRRLLPAVNRSRKQAIELRGLLSPPVEPAATFAPLGNKKT
jgi:hypothetical protein